MAEKKWVYAFDEVNLVEQYVGGSWEGVRSLLGGKGSGLADMTRAEVPVPPGFTVTTEACNAYQAEGKFPPEMWEQELEALLKVEYQTGKKFGDPNNPLLVSCRSGAKFSMPGMMDTVLNIGLTDATAEGLVKLTNNPRFVYDSYRRLVEMFGTVVLGIPDEAFEQPLADYKQKKGYKLDTEMTAEDWKAITGTFKAVVKKEYGKDFPQDPKEQLKLATEAVFKSWNGKRAVDYRRATGIPDDLGTAVNIVTMVFGNMGDDSGTGVAFTRDPSTGDRKMFGEYLLNAQGEDVVAGIRNADPIEQLGSKMPEAYNQFMDITSKLEKHYKDMQDVEFTIERGKLWMLQTRNAKRTAIAAIKIALDMVKEGLISKDEAVGRITPEQIDTLLHPQFVLEAMRAAKNEGRYYASGVNASPGAAVGQIYFDADTAEMHAKQNKEDVIMVRPFTKPDDVHGMIAAKGVLTSEGGATSHAAVVARQFGIPCVVGASMIKIDLENRQMSVDGKLVKEGEWISVDGTTGEVYTGKILTFTPKIEEQTDLLTLLQWADEICARPGMRKFAPGWPTKGLQVWANADYPKDAQRARSYGAVGIGLCRTEHMFFEKERLPIVQAMILNADEAQTLFNKRDRILQALETGKEAGQTIGDEQRLNLEKELKQIQEEIASSKAVKTFQESLANLLPSQRSDFYGLFEAMDGYPVIIRLIDPPLHEFMPPEEELLEEVIAMRIKGVIEGLSEKEHLLQDIQGMHESNPMMGLRGIRLGIVYPDIVKMQVRAIFEAACEAALKGIKVKPEIMIPLTGTVKELEWVQPKLVKIAREVMDEKKIEFPYKFGTMIEIPRAAATAAEIAEYAEFFSFGTNDLTQMTFGYSRDDAERNFLITYIAEGILLKNPFQTIDRAGWVSVASMAVIPIRSNSATSPAIIM
jgi:pyruvate,orthophosphate dikinase